MNACRTNQNLFKMSKIKKVLVFGIVIISILLAGCASSNIQCTQDSDCVAATCCHATTVVNKDNAPNCREAICTASCEPDTLDCGQGQIRCVNNQCGVVFENA